MLSKVREFIAANDLFRPGDRIGVAVSGGIDSVCLLHVLMTVADPTQTLIVCHFDHGLRTESTDDAAFVRNISAAWGLACRVERLDVKSYAKAKHLSLEMAARELRYAALNRLAAALGLNRIALGHHQGDQVETVLLRIIRGTGLDGLGGMDAKRADGLMIRPLLCVNREEIRDYAAKSHLSWVEDSTNSLVEIPRNRVRHELLPQLRRDYNPGVEGALLGLAALAREAREHLEKELTEVWDNLGIRMENSGMLFNGPVLLGLPGTLARLALRRFVALAGGDPGRLSKNATERLWHFIRGTGGRRLSIPGGLTMVRRGGDFFLGRVQAAPAISGLSLAGPGIAVLPDGRGIKAAYWDGNPPGWQDVGKDEAFVDGDLLAWPLSIRSRRPGDRFHPLGLQGGKKVKEVLIEAKIPRESRNAVPLVVDGSGRVIWLAGLRADQRFRITAETRHILHLTLGARELPLCD